MGRHARQGLLDEWETALLNAGSRADERGCSLSDHLLGQDEGSAPVGPLAFPVAAAANAKAVRL